MLHVNTHYIFFPSYLLKPSWYPLKRTSISLLPIPFFRTTPHSHISLSFVLYLTTAPQHLLCLEKYNPQTILFLPLHITINPTYIRRLSIPLFRTKPRNTIFLLPSYTVLHHISPFSLPPLIQTQLITIFLPHITPHSPMLRPVRPCCATLPHAYFCQGCWYLSWAQTHRVGSRF